MKNLFLCVLFFIPFAAHSQTHAEAAERLKNKGLSELMAYSLLNDLITAAGPRLSGSEGYEKAVRWGTEALKAAGADSVWVEPVMIPHWVRGDIENAEVTSGGSTIELSICALGGSIGTPREGITGEVIEVRSFDDVKKLGEKGRGAIIFFNRPFDATKVNTGEAYGGAVNQRTSGAVEAAKIGAAAVLVRSMTNAVDDEPHTGAMRYEDSIRKIPAAAVSTADANMLSSMLKKGKKCTATIRLSAKTLQDRSSYNVIGQITGREFPNEIILVGGHLDSWDKGTGAHDDGSGIAHSIETIRLIASSGLRPKRTIRVVLYANEENGLRGGKAYAARSAMRTEKHLAAIESDAGGFLPRGFGVSSDSIRFERIRAYASLLEMVGAEKIRRGGGGADISTLEPFGTVMIGLNPESQRYFDYHHSNHDTIDKVHPRELELGAIAISILSWVLAQDGM